MEQIKDIFKQVRQAKGSLAFCKEEIINDTLYALADRVEAATDRILEENAKDLAAMDPSNPKYDRLKLTAERIHAIAQGIRQVATLPSPSGRCGDHPENAHVRGCCRRQWAGPRYCRGNSAGTARQS